MKEHDSFLASDNYNLNERLLNSPAYIKLTIREKLPDKLVENGTRPWYGKKNGAMVSLSRGIREEGPEGVSLGPSAGINPSFHLRPTQLREGYKRNIL